MNKLTLFIAAGIITATTAFSPDAEKLITKTGHIKFFSHTVAEDISANNYKVTSTLAPSTGDMVFSVPMQSFEFEKAMMQKHFNSPKFLDTKQFPKAKFKGKIGNLDAVDFGKDGTYKVNVSGDLTMHGVTKQVKADGEVVVSGSNVNVTSNITITLADYNIAFEKGKPSTNIAKTIEITIKMDYKPAG